MNAQCAFMYQMNGTRTGYWLDIKATGKSVVITAVNVDHVVNGIIFDYGDTANMLELLLGIRLMKPVGKS
jgi:hypothetical protein